MAADAAAATHSTSLLYSAGTRTYKVKCVTCGVLRGISTTQADARAKEAQHRRDKDDES